MRLANLDLDCGVPLSPTPNESLHFAEAFDVFVVRSVLADFKSTSCFAKDNRQVGEPVQEEAVGDEHQLAVGPVLACELDVLGDLRVQQWFATEQCESFWFESARPMRVLGVGVFDRGQLAGDVMVAKSPMKRLTRALKNWPMK